MGDEEARKLAEDHWEWLETHFHILFVDAFMHGYKHAREAIIEADKNGD